MSIWDKALSLARRPFMNEDSESRIEEGVKDKIGELSFDMPDKEIIELTKQWRTKWSEYIPEIEERQKRNENYWKGLSHAAERQKPFDNVIFESIETLLSNATKANPEPTVSGSNEESSQEFAKTVKKVLIYHADRLRLKLRIKRVAKYWAFYLNSASEMGWSLRNNDITIEVIKTKGSRLILDPNACVNDDMEYTGSYLGKFMEKSASALIKMYPKSEDKIRELVDDKLGTKIGYYKWYTDEACFVVYEDTVFTKYKNPHWNWDTEEKKEIEEYTDSFGDIAQREVVHPGKSNHFDQPKIPFIFLSINNLGDHPHDDTSLLEQVIPQQDIIDKRLGQIDKNADGMNGGWIISGESGLSREQGSRVVEELIDGNAVFIDEGDPRQVIHKVTGTALPRDIYEQQISSRENLKNVLGVQGTTTSGIQNEDTVGGKILITERDTSRVAGTISEYLEQYTDQVFNWMLQLMYVHYDEEHSISILGDDESPEFISIMQDDLFKEKMTVSVKAGSMIPKDALTLANQAVGLFEAGAIGPITLLKKLEYPDPLGTAGELYKWQNAPQTLFPEEGQEIMDAQQDEQLQQGETDATLALERSEAENIGQPPIA